jgi:hypothetical protein
MIGNARLVDDYVVRHDLRAVGRIHLVDPRLDTGLVWEWGINLPLPTPWWCLGRVYSFEEAKIAFLGAWTRYHAQLSTEQVELWHKQQDAAPVPLTKPRDLIVPIDSAPEGPKDIAAQINGRPLPEAD